MADTVFVASTVIHNDSAATVAVSVPTGTQNGDLMLAAMWATSAGANSAITPPTGWTLVQDINDSTGFLRLAVYQKIAGASEPASYTWTWASAPSGATAGAILTYRNVDPSGVDVSSQNTPTTSATCTSASVTPTRDREMAIFFTLWNSSGATVTPPSGWTDRVNNTSFSAMDAAENLRTPISAFTASSQYGTVRNMGVMVVIKAALPIVAGRIRFGMHI